MYTRMDISLEDRLEIFSQFWRYQDDHGFVSQLAREWETSRHFIYSLAERVRAAVDWQVPGRKPADRLEQEHDHLKQRVRELESECNDLSGQLEVERQDKRDRRFRLLLELALCPVSEDKIARCLGAAFGVVPSAGWINEQINRAGEAALCVMQRAEVRGALREAALDEVFMGDQPILTLVDPRTLMAVVPEAAESRQGETWKRVIEQYPHLELVVSDQGSGLLKGVAISEREIAHQYDLFHFKRNLRREVRRLESHCYEEMEKVERARKLIDYTRLLSSARVQATVEHKEKARALDEKLEAFDWLEVIIAYIEEHCAVYDPRHQRMRGYAEAQRGVDEALELLGEIRAINISEIIKQVVGARAGLFIFLQVLEKRIKQVAIEWHIIEGSREAVCNAVARVWYWRSRAGRAEKNSKEYITALMGLEYWSRRVENFAEVRDQVMEALEQVRRASSAVECLNSIIRPYVSVKKHLNQKYLALIALYWDMRGLPQRAGRTPFEASGVELESADWIEVLEIEMNKQRSIHKRAA